MVVLGGGRLVLDGLNAADEAAHDVFEDLFGQIGVVEGLCLRLFCGSGWGIPGSCLFRDPDPGSHSVPGCATTDRGRRFGAAETDHVNGYETVEHGPKGLVFQPGVETGFLAGGDHGDDAADDDVGKFADGRDPADGFTGGDTEPEHQL